jgi:hypothetical protein
MSGTSQRCPILCTSGLSLPYRIFHPWQRGHFYFVKEGTFLLWLDRVLAKLVRVNASKFPLDKVW